MTNYIEIVTMIIVILFGIIGYFLKNTMNDLKETKVTTYLNKGNIDVIKTDYANKVSNLEGKFDMLYKAIEKLSDQITELNKKIK